MQQLCVCVCVCVCVCERERELKYTHTNAHTVSCSVASLLQGSKEICLIRSKLLPAVFQFTSDSSRVLALNKLFVQKPPKVTQQILSFTEQVTLHDIN